MKMMARDVMPELTLPAIPQNDAAGADAARAALDSAAELPPENDGASAVGEAHQPAPQTPSGEPAARASVTAPTSAATVAPGKKKLSKRALMAMKKGALLKEVAERDDEIAALTAKLDQSAASSSVVMTLPADHHKKLAREIALTLSGAAVVFTQNGVWQLNPRQLDRLSEAYGEVIRTEVPAALQSSPWGAAIMATLGVSMEKYLEFRDAKIREGIPPGPSTPSQQQRVIAFDAKPDA